MKSTKIQPVDIHKISSLGISEHFRERLLKHYPEVTLDNIDRVERKLATGTGAVWLQVFGNKPNHHLFGFRFQLTDLKSNQPTVFKIITVVHVQSGRLVTALPMKALKRYQRNQA